MVLAQPRGHAVVDQKAKLVHHQAIPAAADFERRECVGVDAVEKFRRIRSPDLDLAERRGIEQADIVPYTENLALDRRSLVLAAARVSIGPPPLADGFEHRAPFDMP